MRNYFLVSIFVLLPMVSFGETCPEWMANKSDLPECPEGTNNKNLPIVPDNYPLGVLVVSDQKGLRDTDSSFTISVVEKVLLASGEKNPMLILPVEDQTFNRVRDHIDQMKASPALKKKWKDSLLQIKSSSYTWQQDYMQSFVNPSTGNVVLRKVEDYSRNESGFDRLVKSSPKCAIESVGAPLKNDGNQRNGIMGGNIEVLPGGICIFGDDHFKTDGEYKKYGSQFCGPGANDQIKVPTFWLKVGHTDELMKVVPNKKQPAPCDFSVTMASPATGLEILKKNRNDNFSPEAKVSYYDGEAQGLAGLCDKFIEKQNQKIDGKKEDHRKGTTKLLFPSELLIPNAFASEVDVSDCKKMTNGDVYDLYTQDEELRNYSKAIQQLMDILKKEVVAKLKKKMPQCRIDIIDMPALFSGGAAVRKGDHYDIFPSVGFGSAVFPSPTNAVAVNDTVISPEPYNNAFKKYIEDAYKKRGLKSDFVNTFEYAHMFDGNLHCSTNAMYICRPKKVK